MLAAMVMSLSATAQTMDIKRLHELSNTMDHGEFVELALTHDSLVRTITAHEWQTELGVQHEDTLGQMMLPTLYDLLLDDYYDRNYRQRDSIAAVWQAFHKHDTSVLPRAYIWMKVSRYPDAELIRTLYESLPDTWERGYLLTRSSDTDDPALYRLVCDYLTRFADSPFSPALRLLRQRMEQIRVHLSYPGKLRSTDSLTVTYYNTNAREIVFLRYRLPKRLSKQGEIGKRLELVDSVRVTCDRPLIFQDEARTVRMAPLGYGRYFVYPRLPEEAMQTPVEELDVRRVLGNSYIVSDLRAFGLYEEGFKKTKPWIVVADARTGQPVERVRVKSGWHLPRRTNEQGEARMLQGTTYLRHDEDRHLYAAIWHYAGYETDAGRLVLLPNATVFRPGDTLKLTAVAQTRHRYQITPPKNSTISLTVMGQGTTVLDTTLLPDEDGAVSLVLPFTDDLRRGTYTVQAVHYVIKGKKKTARSYDYCRVRLEDYRLPTFSVALDDSCREMIREQLKPVTGCAIRTNGLPMADAKVTARVTRHAPYYASLTLPPAVTDAEGRFRFLLPDTLARKDCYGLDFKVSLTAPDGETRDAEIYISLGKEETPVPQAMPETINGVPVDSLLWLPKDSTTINGRELTLRLGVPRDSWVYGVVSSREQLISHEWRYLTPGMYDYTFTLPDTPDDYLDIRFVTTDAAGEHVEAHRHFDGVAPTKLRIVPVSMRSYLTPDAREHWTFRLTDAQGQPTEARMLLSMTDKALETVSSSLWRERLMHPWQIPYTNFETPVYYPNSMAVRSWLWPQLPAAKRILPPYLYEPYRVDEELLAFEESDALYEVAVTGYGYSSAEKVAGVQVRGIGSIQSAKASNDAVFYEEAAVFPVAAVQEDAEESTPTMTTIRLRQGDTRLSLYLPELRTDSLGEVHVDFLTPPDNTEWLVQAMAWTKNGASDYSCRQLMARRTLMLRLQLPRYMRDGDEMQLAYVLSNTADTAREARVELTVRDAETDSLLLRHLTTVQLLPASSQTLFVPYTAAHAGTVTVTARAMDATGAGDGEERRLEVLPLLEPVTEGVPFYMHASDTVQTLCLPLPQSAKDRKVSLLLCNDPIAYIAAQLPAEVDSSALTVNRVAHNLYALSLRNRLAKTYPALIRPVDITWLVQEMRAYVHGGGFSWLKHSSSTVSPYLTMQVLWLLGELSEADALDSRLVDMKRYAVQYLDRELLREEKAYRKAHHDSLPDYGRYAQYAYVRVLQREAMSEDVRRILSATLDSIYAHLDTKELTRWPLWALTFERAGQHDRARAIVNGLRRYATTDAARGMYWNNLPDRWWWYRQVDLQASFLLAFSRIDKRADEVDGLRQWMLLNERTTRWGQSSLNAYATYALMQDLPAGYEPQDTAALQTIPLPDTIACYTVRHTPGRPAWGALLSSFTAPANQLEAFSTTVMKIERRYERVDGRKRNQPLRKGDRIRVTFTLTTDREMDHVVLTDRRPALLEPVELSGCGWVDGTLYYREVRNAEENFYIEHLKRGKTVITYECYVTATGTTLAGLAQAVSDLAPEFTTHTAAEELVSE